LKFTPSGEVVVSVRQKPTSAPTSEIKLCFSVRDTGIGIPADKQRAIFEPFAQADTSTTRRFGGTGLGLAICSRLVEMMHGTIGVESEVGRGSTFQFTAQLHTLGPCENPCAPSFARQRVLVVDDNQTHGAWLAHCCRIWGLEAEHVCDATSARQRLASSTQEAGGRIALLLVDSRMPGEDGFALATSLTSHVSTQGGAVPVIMLLSDPQRQKETARCRTLGLPHYLTKPLRESDLRRALQEALDPAHKISRGEERSAERTTRHVRRKRILLAEDNLVNQMLAIRALEKMGHEVTVAPNGREALLRLGVPPTSDEPLPSARDTYNLVLMDVQMPEMDGLAATRRLREWEALHGGHLPVIAMTANAMKEDAGICLAAGMDGYLAKPIRIEELRGMVDEIAAPPDLACERAEPIATTRLGDRQVALERTGHDGELLRQLIEIFLSDYPQLLAQLSAAQRVGDATTFHRMAHTLKGNAGVFGAEAVVEVARHLEQRGQEAHLHDAETLLHELETLLHSLRSELRSWLLEDSLLGKLQEV
jgi:CheY-like chemotaxis protein